MLKRFLISVIKSLTVIVLATFIFSAVTPDFSKLIKGLFGDVFDYASPEMQKDVVGKLAESCSSLDNAEAITITQLCTNISLLNSMKESCRSYHEYKKRGVKVENEAEVAEQCSRIDSGEIDNACSKVRQSSLLPNLDEIGNLCRSYKNGKINDKEFFFSVISSPITKQIEMPQTGFLEKYNRFMDFLNSNKILYLVVLVVLVALLYLLIKDAAVFLFTLSDISFGIGTLILLPFLLVWAYDKFIGIDTTPILGSIFGAGPSIGFKAILSLIFLLFLRTYNSFTITLGIIFLIVGIIGKVYKKVSGKGSKSKQESNIAKKDKGMGKLFTDLKESLKKDKKK